MVKVCKAVNTIVTACPKCNASQLADGRLIGKLVKCAKCEHEFKCSKKLGPVLWAHEVKEGESDRSFRKVVTKVLFTYGVAVPISHQELFIKHMAVDMSFGSNLNAVIVISGRRYQVGVRYFKNRRDEPSLHFRWKDSDSIGLFLQAELPNAYTHFVVDGNHDYLDGNAVVLEPDDQEGVFKLTVYASNGQEVALKRPHKKEKSVVPSTILKEEGIKDLLSDLAL